MRIVDASVIVSFCIPHDINHISARAFFARKLDCGTSVFARVELAAALKRQNASSEIIKAAFAWLETRLKLVQLEPNLLIAAEDYALASGLRAGDAIYAATAIDLACELVTFDADQAKRAATLKVTTLLLK